MKLVADSGSTKTDWYLVKNQSLVRHTTQGYNPYYWTTEEMKKSLELELLDNLQANEVQELYFYGAGCSNPLNQDVIFEALAPTFSNAEISLGDDLLAAARSTAGHEAGICCILGTGSNSCVYDGQKIIDKIPSLGYILGDEGAGAYIGRQLIRAYFYRELPPHLAKELELSYNMDKHLIISELLNGKTPNRTLASFALFCAKQQEEPFIKKLIENNFEEFLHRHVLKYANATELPIHFVGSIAFGFRKNLIEVLERHHLTAGNIFKSPFPSLLAY
ncbi:hypothetical protein [Aureispira anguillae]|uniref:N-acetylglucosamine kinase n=1 Tax=Aureispira anguillae TaxID=2864201 RepID=A0A915YI30_9BACT|nr:hypothetical protein [Aureispira anguillae]BDS13592.1 hypothetical protein AsAng_0043310 [Aureispira anguillae]